MIEKEIHVPTAAELRDKSRQLIADLERENAALRGVLEKWKTWCELNRRE